MNELKTQLPTDTWVDCTWEEFIQATTQPEYAKAKCYYYNGQLRLEMSPVGTNHSLDNGLIVLLVNLFGIAKGIPLKLLINCSYRQPGIKEAQPDASYYVGERVTSAPTGSSVVNLEFNPPPDLVIEVADTSLTDDIGQKRLLYEDLAVGEYWVVDVNKAQVIAFKILSNGGSQRISESSVLPGLAITRLEEGLQRSRDTDNTTVAAWFLQAFSQ
ncbi:Uma2 family endonuclease [Chroogloeocystis siderophila]|jgi:Uma2 family endonuclease|uniref:Putative restriction endonuclease domain-containing protein n=1 Tax=Chroogloeocystis siderophila 5.2 s.c.1 TaxID=247279 RepID=A0A1U7HYP4_9CHRO|nr:Uma2 family endonuclease [Chroogloeocystis siderophila]OKH28752.1 hypothetical protein NIES1031_02285 [Chroogloeocystis siderophila 5.2 s.c.1]